MSLSSNEDEIAFLTVLTEPLAVLKERIALVETLIMETQAVAEDKLASNVCDVTRHIAAPLEEIKRSIATIHECNVIDSTMRADDTGIVEDETPLIAIDQAVIQKLTSPITRIEGAINNIGKEIPGITDGELHYLFIYYVRINIM